MFHLFSFQVVYSELQPDGGGTLVDRAGETVTLNLWSRSGDVSLNLPANQAGQRRGCLYIMYHTYPGYIKLYIYIRHFTVAHVNW